MKRNLISFALILIAGFTTSMTSCERTKEETPPGDPVQIELTLKQTEVVESANKFAFDLFVPIVAEKKGAENIMISPFSVTSALSMTLNGAAGETFEAMMTALRYDGKTIGEINETYLKLMKDMVPVDPRVVMEIANSVWVEKRLTVKQPFIDALKTWYLAEAKNIDVTDPGAVDMVNGWIEEKTHDKIQNMLDELSPDLAMLLINAVYFNGKWRHQFEKKNTDNKSFFVTPGSPVLVPMMFQNENFAVTRSGNATLIELPYGQGNYSMVVMLPDEGVSTASVAVTLTPESWALWMADLARGTTEVDLSLPRFKYEYKRELKDDLTALGMGIAFTDFADFSNISNQGLLISRVLHQTFIETNEEGTEAAAATVVEMELTSMPMTTVININRPFLYFIRETTTGTIVFMGQVADPSKD
ncbi:MAG: serpin family protein [Bacteroidales bacterium]|nr:serpin family protein [Bacteroidales bacterium]